MSGRRRWGRMLAVTVVLGGVLGLSARVHARTSQRMAAPQGYLGVELREVPAEQMSALRMKGAHGVEITRVDHDGPAGKAGLHEHDVIVQFDGQTISGLEPLRKALRETTPGVQVSLTVLRDGQQQTISAMLANREEVERRAWEQHIVVADPDGGGGPAAEGAGGPASLGFLHGAPVGAAPSGRTHGFLGTMLHGAYTGVELEPISPQLGEFFGVQSGAGLLVKSVDANSPGAVAGLRAGDVVIKANQATMVNEGDWTRQLHDSKGQPMPVLVVRERKEQTLLLTVDVRHRSRNEPPVELTTAGVSARD